MFVDLGETSTGRSDSSAASHAGRTTNVVLCLMATALIGSSVVGWRLISVWESQHAELQRSNRVFNQELVQAVQSLAENTGVLTSADLSPVKFRLRSAKGPGSSPPARSVSAELLKATDSGTYQNVTNDMSRPSGLLDFGLQEPGQYRLRIKLPDGMATAHDFEVLPGVPVDRLVRIPLGSPKGTEYSIVVEWPRDLPQARIAAICRIEPCGAELEEWKWSAPPQAAGELMWSQNCTLRPGDAVVAGIVPCEMIPMPGALEARVPLDCRYWELAEIIFVRLSDSEDASECVVLGSARFGDIADDEATLVGDEAYCPIWRVAGERPGWEAEGTTEWRLPLPPEIVEHLSIAIDWSAATADRRVPSSQDRPRRFELFGRGHPRTAEPVDPFGRQTIETFALWNAVVPAVGGR